MPEIICNTSPFQYLHQTEQLHLLPALARQVAGTLGLSLTGTLGLLLDAKKANLIPLVKPILDQLQALRFRLAPHTRAAILKWREKKHNYWPVI